MSRSTVARALAVLAAQCSLGVASGVGAAPVALVEVDAREAPRGVLKAHLTLPVAPGPLTLLYPKWLPGRHAPAGPITSLAGPRLRANGAAVAWRRDRIEPYAFHLVVPAGAALLEADLEVLTAPAPDGIVQGLESPRQATESLAIIEWNQVVLYPPGTPTDQLSYRASIRLPTGWHYATALEGSEEAADGTRFAPTSLTTLVDSTLLAGLYLRTFELGATPAVRLSIAADRESALAKAPEQVQHYRNLVREARALFGATHYRHYTFLWALTDQIMEDGIEHHESSDNRSPLQTMQDDDLRRAEANLLPHEYTHSWNGKYRRPAGLATPDYEAPMNDELLWVYEGLTEYLGDVLAARSGLLTAAEFRDEFARIAAQMDVHHGRDWRSLEDAVDAAQLLYYQDHNWAARLRRQDDFYQESALLWLEADTLIRHRSGGKRSLDDFCRLFYGGEEGPPRVVPYDFDAVVAALNQVQPYAWREFWLERLHRKGGGAPLAGIESAGWHLALTAIPSSMHVAHENEDRELNLQYSLGLAVGVDGGAISDIVPGSPADIAGAAPGSHLIAINGHRFTRETLHDVLAVESAAADVLTLLVAKEDEYRTLELHYHGGERYPNLLRGTGEDLLAAIARPQGPEAAARAGQHPARR